MQPFNSKQTVSPRASSVTHAVEREQPGSGHEPKPDLGENIYYIYIYNYIYTYGLERKPECEWVGHKSEVRRAAGGCPNKLHSLESAVEEEGAPGSGGGPWWPGPSEGTHPAWHVKPPPRQAAGQGSAGTYSRGRGDSGCQETESSRGRRWGWVLAHCASSEGMLWVAGVSTRGSRVCSQRLGSSRVASGGQDSAWNASALLSTCPQLWQAGSRRAELRVWKGEREREK